MNNSHNTTISSNDNSSEQTSEAVEHVLRMLQDFGGIDWFKGRTCLVGLTAVAAAHEADRRVGTQGVTVAMVNFLYLSRHLRSEPGHFPKDERADFAFAAIRELADGRLDATRRNDLYDRCVATQKECSLFGYCMLQVAQAALCVERAPSPFDRAALNIATELTARLGEAAALDFAAYLRRAAPPAHAA